MPVDRRGVLTPANAVSAAGITMVGLGLREGLDTPKGIGLVGVGRVLDMVDGYVARKTGTSSDLGAMVDAIFDKAGLAAIAVHEIQKGMLPGHIATGIFVQNGMNAIATAVAQKRNLDAKLEPSIAGKRAMFAQNVGIGFMSIAGALADSHPRLARAISHSGQGIANIGTYVYGSHATWGYLRRTSS